MHDFLPLLAGVMLCVACGGAFEASPSHGSTAGAENGGSPNGVNAGFGGAGVGGASVGGTGGGSAGASEAGANAGGSFGNTSAGAGSAGADCATLREAYVAALAKARLCDKGSTNQCSADVTLAPIACGCPVLVNSKSAAALIARQRYQAFQDAHCDSAICDIACLPFMAAECVQQSGPSNAFVCGAPG